MSDSPRHEWNKKALGDPLGADSLEISDEVLEKEAVILAEGLNMFGDQVYSYLKFPMRNFIRLRDAMAAGENFTPSDYGTVIAAGRGEPPQELKDEMRIQYGLVDTPKPEQKAPPPISAPKLSLFDEDDGF
jgi:hypothetical protein